MRYCICVPSNYGLVIKDEYESQEEAETKLQNKRLAKLKPVVKLVPTTIGVGYKIYVKGEYYATIVAESPHLWFTKKTDDELISSPWDKETFDLKFINGHFDPVDEELAPPVSEPVLEEPVEQEECVKVEPEPKKIPVKRATKKIKEK